MGLMLITLILISFRIWLPNGVRSYVNNVLADIPGYHGAVQDIDMQLLRGAYVIEGLHLNKIEAVSEVPFISISRADISIEWAALLRGRIVTAIKLTQPEVMYVLEDHDAVDAVDPSETDWTEALRDLVPIDVNSFEIVSGKIGFLQLSATPAIDIYLHQLQLLATNLSNVVARDGTLNSSIEAHAVSIGNGQATLNGQMNLLRRIPDVDMSFSLEHAAAESLNDFSEHYSGVDFEKGTVNVYGELAIADGHLVGYVKPMLEDFELHSQEDQVLETLWEALVGFVGLVLENEDEGTVASKVPFEGNLNDLNTGVLTAVLNVFRNAWIEAFKRTVDDEIEFEDALEAVD
tara:strand:+ start:202445 stop:203488 length:1044 start_codon:yes stop_codon:yes gene_type:complete